SIILLEQGWCMAYRLLYPIRTYLVVSGRYGEEVNVMAADWVMPVSAKPFMVAVAIAPTRYTYRLVEKYGEFVVSVPSVENLRDVWIAGSEHGPGKLRKTSFDFAPASRVGTPVIRNALANLECRVVDKHVYGDHVLYVGEVLAYHHREDAYVDFEPRLEAGFLAHIAMNKFTKFAREVVTVQ
ncbi:MAG: flavin reductase family protein, partial [Candidatus Nezhaarchaeales archaeon]